MRVQRFRAVASQPQSLAAAMPSCARYLAALLACGELVDPWLIALLPVELEVLGLAEAPELDAAPRPSTPSAASVCWSR